MAWQVEYASKAVKQFKKLDPKQAKIILSWIEKNLLGCEDPRWIGKPLEGNLKDYWRYRVGSYRLVAKLEDRRLVIVIVMLGHRKGIYR